MNRRILLTAAAVFAAGTIGTLAHAETVHCAGTNACKGQSACKGANNACKGLNGCKGEGFTEMGSAAECTAKGGKVI